MPMLNRLSGWLLFSQVAYITLFALLTLTDKLTGGSIFRATAGLRRTLNLENTWLRLSDYLYSPLIGTVPLNLLLMLVFCWTLLRSRRPPVLTTDFFCVANTLVLSPCIMLLFVVFDYLRNHW